MDLSTTYLGLKLKNPMVPSSSPLSRNLGSLRRMEDSGASAIVLYSLFEEQITLESQTLNHYLTQGVESFPEARVIRLCSRVSGRMFCPRPPSRSASTTISSR